MSPLFRQTFKERVFYSPHFQQGIREEIEMAGKNQPWKQDPFLAGFVDWLKIEKGLTDGNARGHLRNSNRGTGDTKAAKLFREYSQRHLPQHPVLTDCSNFLPAEDFTPPAPRAVCDVELPAGGVLSTRLDDCMTLPPGRYLFDVLEGGGLKIYPCTESARQAASEVLSEECGKLRAELEEQKAKLAESKGKFKQLQDLLLS